MQYLITGVPGAGKSQRALWKVLNDARFINRPVAYCNFGSLNIGDPRLANWTELHDFRQWHKLPAGTVLIVDEVQSRDILPGRSASAATPEHVEAFSKSRKLGIDIILVTQHPKNMDLFVRRMIETHEHLTRVGQFEYATVTEYQGYQDVDNKVDESTVISRTRWAYDKTIWTLYKSAELHTVKKKVPRIVYKFAVLLVLAVLLIGGAGYYVSKMGKKTPDAASVVAVPTAAAKASSQANESLSRMAPLARVEQLMHLARDWQFERIPVDADFPESAPMYDSVREIKSFPRVSGCATSKNDCRCVDQQGTPARVSTGACLDYVANGRFDPYRDEPRAKDGGERSQTVAASAALGSRPDNCATFVVYGIGGTSTIETRCTSSATSQTQGAPQTALALVSPAGSGQTGVPGSMPTATVQRGGYVEPSK